MATSIASFDAILKDVYKPAILEQLYSKSPLLSLIEKDFNINSLSDHEWLEHRIEEMIKLGHDFLE